MINLQEISHQACNHDLIEDAFCFYDNQFIYLIAKSQLSPTEIKSFLKSKLPSYMIPHKVILIEKIFRNSSNKINKTQTLQYFDFYLHHQACKYLARLDSSISNSLVSIRNKTKILITGANGYLGIHLASQMSPSNKLILLVRAKSLEQARERVISQAQKYELILHWDNIEIVIGDCSKPNFGLDREILNEVKDIIHCAAEVNNIKRFEQLFNSNIQSTYEAIQICINYRCKLQYISTLSVHVSTNNTQYRKISQSGLFPSGHEFIHGYGASKYFAEVMVQKAIKNKQINGTIYRLGLLTENVESSYVNINSFLYLTLKEIQKTPVLPLLQEEKYIDLTPINWIVTDLIKLIKEDGQSVYNLSYNIKLSYTEICEFFKKTEYTAEYKLFNHQLINLF